MIGGINKKYKNGSLVFLFILFTMGIMLALVSWSTAESKKNTTPVKEKAQPKEEQETTINKHIPEGSEMLNERYKWFFDGRRGPDGFIPANARMNAFRQEEANIRNGLLQAGPTAIPGNTWSAVGPAPLGSYSGRVSAMIAIDANTIYAGGAQGGIWKTTNAGTTWTPLTDQKETLATGSIAVDPTNPNIIYVGTGESNHSCDSYYGAGILKTTDAGTTWTLIGNSYFQNTSISKLIIHPTNPLIMWASNTRGTGGFICQRPTGTYGVWKTTDGGTTWNVVLGQAQTGVASWTLDMVIDQTDPLILFAGVYASGVWKTTNGGTNWTLLAGGLPTTTLGVMDLAIDPTNHLTLYFTVENSTSGAQLGFYKTTNGGTNWSSMTMPGGLCSTYCWYCMYVDVSPDGAYVFLGGVGLYRSANSGCCSWTTIGSSVHVDQHAMAWAPGDTHVWIGNDGGVYQSTTLAATSWTNKNTGIYITQFYPGCSLHPTNANGAVGGTQDNSTAQYSGTTSWAYRYGGDGAFTAYDQSAPNTTWYASSQNLDIEKTTNNGANFSPAGSGIDTTNAAFIAPFVICPNNSAHLIAVTDNVWRTTNSAGSWTTNSPDPLVTGNVIIRAAAYAPSDSFCLTYFVGVKNGNVYRTTVGGGTTGWTNISTGLPTDANQYRGVNDLAVHPTNGNIVYAAISGFGGPHLYKTINALAATPTWSASDTAIPDIPVNAVVIDPTETNVVYIGTDIGIYRSTDSGATWQTFNNGHPRVAVYDLLANGTTNTIMSFTHGRAAFKLITVAGTPGEVPMKSGAGSPLTLQKAGTNLALSWSAPGGTCIPTDYGIYRGTIGTYPSHTQFQCSTGGTTNATIAADTGSYYYLVVARTATEEGSYGKNSSGTERARGTSTCVATSNINSC